MDISSRGRDRTYDIRVNSAALYHSTTLEKFKTPRFAGSFSCGDGKLKLPANKWDIIILIVDEFIHNGVIV